MDGCGAVPPRLKPNFLITIPQSLNPQLSNPNPKPQILNGWVSCKLNATSSHSETLKPKSSTMNLKLLHLSPQTPNLNTHRCPDRRSNDEYARFQQAVRFPKSWSHLTESLNEVVLQKSIPAQIRQVILYYY